jgi:hypothetical protein
LIEELKQWYSFFRESGMKPNIINTDERLPVLKIVRELKSTVIELPIKTVIELPIKKEKKENRDIPPHKYIMPEQPKGYMKHNELDLL